MKPSKRVTSSVYADGTPNNPNTSRKGDKPANWAHRVSKRKQAKAPVYVYHGTDAGLVLVGMYKDGKPVQM